MKHILTVTEYVIIWATQISLSCSINSCTLKNNNRLLKPNTDQSEAKRTSVRRNKVKT